MRSSFATITALALGALSAADAQWHRMEEPSSYLRVESCRDIDQGIFHDPEGSCESVGYNVPCWSCHAEMEFFVARNGTCDQRVTKCHFHDEDEKCIGASQCPY